jgi:branched-chain amino acid transport system ATP-binding protein
VNYSEIHPFLRIDSVSKDFGGLRAIHRVSFNIQRGSITSIIGPNGAGKTTIFNLITGFLCPSEGDIYFRDKRLNGLPTYRIVSMGISRAFQNLRLFTNLTVVENVLVGRHLQGKANLLSSILRIPCVKLEEKRNTEEAFKLISLFALESVAFHLVSSLPYGHQKRVAVARALATKPDLLLLDEPAGGLTSQEMDQIRQILLKVRESGVTIVLVEHRMELVMDVSDKILVLHHGRKLAEGSPKEIQGDQRVIDVYLGRI